METTRNDVWNFLMRQSKDELEEWKDVIEDKIIDIEHEEARNRTLTREQIIKTFDHYGYIVPKDAKFWKVMALGDGFGGYGMEVGEYTHSCHIDTTECKVLLVVNGDKHFTESYSDLWLRGPF